MKNGRGYHNHSEEHALNAKGIKTKQRGYNLIQENSYLTRDFLDLVFMYESGDTFTYNGRVCKILDSWDEPDFETDETKHTWIVYDGLNEYIISAWEEDDESQVFEPNHVTVKKR